MSVLIAVKQAKYVHSVVRERNETGWCAGNSHVLSVLDRKLGNLMKIDLTLNGKNIKGIINSGCSNFIVVKELVNGDGKKEDIIDFYGTAVLSQGKAEVEIIINKREEIIEVAIMKNILEGIKAIIG